MPATFADLVSLMERLRSPAGCPWDKEQTYASLAPMLLEEAYETFEAVEAARLGNATELRDELGDLLFQIVFYAQVAKERGEFTIADVVDAVHTKMVRRHPHVFATAVAKNADEVLKDWEAIKAEEKRAAGKDKREDSLLEGVSLKTPALMEAHQLSTKAARVGFDWSNIEEVFAKLHEEIDELRRAIAAHAPSEQPSIGDADVKIREEIGDLLFVVVNLARHLGIEPEAALKLTNRKFRARFRHIERELAARGRTPDTATLEELEALWQDAKQREEK